MAPYFFFCFLCGMRVGTLANSSSPVWRPALLIYFLSRVPRPHPALCHHFNSPGRDRGTHRHSLRGQVLSAQVGPVRGLPGLSSSGIFCDQDLPSERRGQHWRHLCQHSQKGLVATDNIFTRSVGNPMPPHRALPRVQLERRGGEAVHGELRRVPSEGAAHGRRAWATGSVQL